MPRTDELLTRARAALPEAAYRTGDFDAIEALARCESMAGHHETALAHSQEALDLQRAGSYRPRVVDGAVEARRVVEAALPWP